MKQVAEDKEEENKNEKMEEKSFAKPSPKGNPATASRVFEFQRKPGYKEEDKPAKFGSEATGEKWDDIFAKYPQEFINHVYKEHKCKLYQNNLDIKVTKLSLLTDVYAYDGPLVVLSLDVALYAGEKDSSTYCPFCAGLYKRLGKHMRTMHSDEAEVQEVVNMKIDKEKQAGYDRLARKGNFMYNVRCTTARKGLILPYRRSKGVRDIRTMVHCILCLIYIEKRNYNKHVDACPDRHKNPGTLAQVKLMQAEVYV